MSLKEDMLEDLDIFYDTDEFATSAQYKDNDISILFQEDLELFGTEKISISIPSSNGISMGDKITINSILYEILNFEYKDDSELEYLVALKKK